MTTPATTGRLQLVLDVTYRLNGADLAALQVALQQIVEGLVRGGMLTAAAPAAEIQSSAISVMEFPQLDEDTLAELMLARIENGDLDLEDIPVRLARYELMAPAAFCLEMAERMEMSRADVAALEAPITAACSRCKHPAGADWLDDGETCPICRLAQ